MLTVTAWLVSHAMVCATTRGLQIAQCGLNSTITFPMFLKVESALTTVNHAEVDSNATIKKGTGVARLMENRFQVCSSHTQAGIIHGIIGVFAITLIKPSKLPICKEWRVFGQLSTRPMLLSSTPLKAESGFHQSHGATMVIHSIDRKDTQEFAQSDKDTVIVTGDALEISNALRD